MTGDRLDIIKRYVTAHPQCSSTEIFEGIGLVVAYATVRRDLAKLVTDGILIMTGKGKRSRYSLSPSYNLFQPVDLDVYFSQEIDQRQVNETYNFDLINPILASTPLFNKAEIEFLNSIHWWHTENLSKLSPAQYRKEMERLGVDLSWKSSQIEGNTYSLLETERLLLEKETAAGKSKDEAVMLLNHKDALDFILDNPDYLSELTVAKIETIHSILVKELAVDRNIRTRRVGITGTNYRPLDNEFQIREALEQMCHVVNEKANIFEKALLVLLLVSYIQPFNDGNKRTARIVSNALLIANNYCPLSFRTVDSIDYKKAMLLFYEQNNLSAFKQIFMEQFAFAVKTYF